MIKRPLTDRGYRIVSAAIFLMTVACSNLPPYLTPTPPAITTKPPTIDPQWQSATKKNTTFTFDPVFIHTPTKVEGNGARFKAQGSCATITANHVVSSTNKPIIKPTKTATSEASIERADKALDIAIIKQRHENLTDCPTLPTTDEISQAITNSTLREIWHIDAGGNITPIRVDLIQATDNELQVSVTQERSAYSNIKPGMSGSLVVFDKTPVGIITTASTTKTNTSVKAIRLDTIMQRFPQELKPDITQAPIITKPSEPYELSQLPKFYQEVVELARFNKQKAIEAKNEAEKIQLQAEDAAAIAKTLPSNFENNGYAHYIADNQNDYAGQVYSIGNRLFAAGYGISIVGDSDSFGDKYYCKFVRNKGCNGFGVIEYTVNKSNINSLEAWMGGFEDDHREGYGYLKWKKIPTKPHQGEAWFYSSVDKNTTKPGVWKESDGRLFEGYIGQAWDGWGVLWAPDGKVLRLGKMEGWPSYRKPN
ncbi:hypothetical protein [Plasticicumulans sp.]|uniref:hypothetical protein n=1 Tax=Plasticicumulans sp. TaxID=2307179 RepID=UPI003954B9EB